MDKYLLQGLNFRNAVESESFFFFGGGGGGGVAGGGRGDG